MPESAVPNSPATIISPAISTSIGKLRASRPSSINSLVSQGCTSTNAEAQTDKPSSPAIARRWGRTKLYSQRSDACRASGFWLSISRTIRRCIRSATV
ncbi:hypothetical protein D3C75_1145080 [compost metagenome]